MGSGCVQGARRAAVRLRLRPAEGGRENLARNWAAGRKGTLYRVRDWLAVRAGPLELRRSVLALRPEEISGPIGSGRRIQLVLLSDREPVRQLGFSDVADALREDLRDPNREHEKREALRRLNAEIGVLLQASYQNLPEDDP
jgi:hypothetical protein